MRSHSTSQHVEVIYVTSLTEVKEVLDDYVKPHDLKNRPYYLHIDHVHIENPNEHGLYTILFIWHREYLEKGE